MQIHGSWDIKRVTHNILAIKIFDAWNLEAAIAFGEELKEAAQPFIGDTWAILLSVQQADAVAPPEVIPVVQELNQWCINNGCRCEAHIVRSSLQRDFNELTRSEEAKALPPPSYSSETGYTHAYFDNLENAVTFLAQYKYYLPANTTQLAAWFDTNSLRQHF